MRVKVSLSPEAWGKFYAGENFEVPGQWMVYYKRHIFDKWRPYGHGYADKNWAIATAKEVKATTVII